MNSERFLSVCVDNCRLDPGKGILAAFSGGADSLSLLISLKEAGFAVTAAHFNHHLRAEAGADEESAGRLASELGIPFISGGADVPAVVREQKLSVEEAARHCRYRWLLGQAAALNMQAVAIGHTADDQVETVLMHLLRGSGLDGLTGMPFRQFFPLWNAQVPVVRPLLETWRRETEEICREAGLEPVQDASNQSTRFFRNRIRLELVPLLEEYNPQARQHILQTARILTDEQALLTPLKEEAWNACFDSRSSRWISLRQPALKELPESLRKSVLRRGLLELYPALRDVDYEITRRLSDFVVQPSRSGEVHLFNDLWANSTAGLLTLWKGRPGLRGDVPQLEEGQRGLLTGMPADWEFQGWRLEIREESVEEIRDKLKVPGHDDQIWLDADRLIFPLTVRAGHPGERITPLGMQGKTQKLSDYWVNRKIPRQARANWPLVISGDEIVWVAGQGISETAAVTPQTRRVARLCLRRQDRRPDGPV